MSTNKPTTLGYFLKRLRDCGYKAERIFSDYSDTDPRAWTVVIDPMVASILCTCYVNKSELGDNYFEFYDGGQFLPNLKIKTQSIEVLIETLIKYNINNNNIASHLRDTTEHTVRIDVGNQNKKDNAK